MLHKFIMTPRPSLLLVVITLTLFFTTSGAQDRAPHGLNHEYIVALSPSAYNFFHPNAQLRVQYPCEESSCSPMPLAATVQSSLEHESKANGGKDVVNVGAGGIAAIIFSFIFVVILSMGVYYVVTIRRTNLSRNQSTVIPSA
uniref:uncharacterized protein LOC122606025 n=1 Tax=Erigeron canadensis TaxID=72917 RepID=UPI001CB918B7|nr:uncharacterized protein LOC122606025 [Erigeron canadensis]